ncbi:MAG: hypothetical protein QE271_02315 [Bacteriovoracaceae bacterium]|nr:hypothetical protein [Bacteriovoracaceae bacterium]
MVKNIIFFFFIFFIQNVFSQDGDDANHVNLVLYNWGDLNRLSALGKAVDPLKYQLIRDATYGSDAFGRPLIPPELDDFTCGPTSTCAVETAFPQIRKQNLRPIFTFTNPVTSYGYSLREMYGVALIVLEVIDPKVLAINSNNETVEDVGKNTSFNGYDVLHHHYFGRFEEYIVLGSAEIKVTADPFIIWKILNKEVSYLRTFLNKNKNKKKSFAYSLEQHFRKYGLNTNDHLFNVESLPETIKFLSSQENHHQRILHTPLNLYRSDENILSGIAIIKKYIPQDSSQMDLVIKRSQEIQSHDSPAVSSHFLVGGNDSLFWKVACLLNSNTKITEVEYKDLFNLILISSKKVFDLLVPYVQLIKNKSFNEDEIVSLTIYEASKISNVSEKEISIWSILELLPSEQDDREKKIISFLERINSVEDHILFMNFFFKNSIMSWHGNVLFAEYQILKTKYPLRAKDILHNAISKVNPRHLISTFGILMSASLENKRSGIKDSSILIISDILDYLKTSNNSENIKLINLFSKLLNILKGPSQVEPNTCSIFLEELYS